MTLAIFDTHAFIKRLTAAGMPEAQAEVLADEQSRLIGDGTATKADIASFRDDVAKEFAVLKADIDKQFTSVDKQFASVDKQLAVVNAELAMLKWMVGGVGFGTIALVIRSFLHVPG